MSEQSEQRPLSWEYIAAFFDGEGSIGITTRKNSIDITLAIAQKDNNALENIATFLRDEGINGARVYSEHLGEANDMDHLAILTNDGIVSTLAMMAPFLRIKRVQSIASLIYLRSQIIGDEYLKIMNEETRAGRRAGRIHDGDFPFTRREGIENVRRSSMAQACSTYRTMLNSPEFKKRARLGAVERNKMRGLVTRNNILRLLSSDHKDSDEISLAINRSRHQTNLLLKEMYGLGYVNRERTSLTRPYGYQLTNKGRRHLTDLGNSSVP